MTDSTLVHYSGTVTFYQGEIAGGSELYVYDAGTNDLADIFTDNGLVTASANPITADANGRMPFAWIGTGDYKVVLLTSSGATIDEEDDLSGALDTTPFAAASYAKVDEDCDSETANRTLVADDVGTTINCNPSSGNFTITVLSALTIGNGRGVTLRHTGTSGQVIIRTSLSETITGPATDGPVTAFSLTGYGESVTLVSDGANLHIKHYAPPFMRPNTPGIILVADRVSADPSSPTPAARYIVASTFDGYAAESIIEADGNGGFIEYTPPSDCGWLAYVQDEDAYYRYVGAAWIESAADQTLMEAAASVSTYTTPGRQHYHPAHPKVVCSFDFAAGSTNEFNVDQILDLAVGQARIDYSATLSAAGAVVATAEFGTESQRSAQYRAVTTVSHVVTVIGGSNSYGDGDGASTSVYGDLP